MGIIRSAFLIDEKGKIQEAWPKVSPKDTPANLLKASRWLTSRRRSTSSRTARRSCSSTSWSRSCRGSRRRAAGASPATRRSSPGTSRAGPRCPGVLMVEALAQVGAIAVLLEPRYAGKLPLFGGIDGVRFRRQVEPGETLDLRVEMGRLSARAGQGPRHRRRWAASTACEVDLLFVIVDA